ncbi:MAG: hypothetical protein M3Z22_07665, partial [Verrucomicrobiota bacterium]|nr:hypothetical protein [Verrucomicrobiota bacterium]
IAAGCYGEANSGWRELYDGFVPDARVRKLIQKGLFRWWNAELKHLELLLRARPGKRVPAPAPNRAAEAALN